MERIVNLKKKESSARWQPADTDSKAIIWRLFKKKSVSDLEAGILEEANYTVNKSTYLVNYGKTNSTIELPHAFIFYNKAEKIWEGTWKNPETGLSIGKTIQSLTKKTLLEALIDSEYDTRINNL